MVLTHSLYALYLIGHYLIALYLLKSLFQLNIDGFGLFLRKNTP